MFIGLGSNIEPEKNLKQAADLLRDCFEGIIFSSVYKTAPQGFEDQDFFLNAIARFDTNDSPQDVLKNLQNIEQELKKNTPFKNGPRTIDLDLLLYGDCVILRRGFDEAQSDIAQDDTGLEVPHPRMHERRFVLEPLLELLEGECVDPSSGESWMNLLQKTQDQECTKISMVL